jgi:hypothetical protein
MSKLALISGLICFAALGCGRADFSSIEFVGTWTLTDDSRELLTAQIRNARSTLILNADGRFEASDLPGTMLSFEEEEGGLLVSGSGVWSLNLRNNRQEIQLEFRSFSAGQLGGTPYGTHLIVSSNESKPMLYFFAGDPDRGLRVKLEKH